MCSICGRYFCPAGCPGDDGALAGLGFPVGECACCGRNLYGGEKAFCLEEKTICEECAQTLEMDDLLELTGCENTAEILEELGYPGENL